jgi:hypothetical protein
MNKVYSGTAAIFLEKSVGGASRREIFYSFGAQGQSGGNFRAEKTPK